MFFAGAWGYLRVLKLPVPPGHLAELPAGGGSLLHNSTPVLAFVAMLGTALVIGLLVAIRPVSPLAAGLPGLAALAWTALYLVSVRRAVELIPLRSEAFGAGWEALLFNGVLGAAGLVMIFPMFIPSRWRGPRRARQAEPDTTTNDADNFLSTVRPDDESELVGTVVSALGGDIRPVDTSRVTGASRALRATGSFRTSTGSMPRATGSMPRATGSMPRATGSPRTRAESTLGRRYMDE
jgi:hypothetical protein